MPGKIEVFAWGEPLAQDEVGTFTPSCARGAPSGDPRSGTRLQGPDPRIWRGIAALSRRELGGARLTQHPRAPPEGWHLPGSTRLLERGGPTPDQLRGIGPGTPGPFGEKTHREVRGFDSRMPEAATDACENQSVAVVGSGHRIYRCGRGL